MNREIQLFAQRAVLFEEAKAASGIQLSGGLEKNLEAKLKIIALGARASVCVIDP